VDNEAARFYENKRLIDLEERLGTSFCCKSLLVTALSHRAEKEGKLTAREESLRPSLIGDKVCDLGLYERLYFEGMDKGRLDHERQTRTKGPALNAMLWELGIVDFTNLEDSVTSKIPEALPDVGANIVEALVGAIFLDKGFQEAESFVRRHLLKALIQDVSK
jgi:ribonuclease-3